MINMQDNEKSSGIGASLYHDRITKSVTQSIALSPGYSFSQSCVCILAAGIIDGL